MDTKHGSLLLDTFSFLRQCPSEVVDKLKAHGQYRSIGKNTRLYWEGDACSHIAFVLEGEIRVFKIGSSGREITLYEIGPGETCILNASCILSNKRYPANANTLSEVRTMLLPASIFQGLVSTSDTFRAFVFSLLSERLLTVLELVDELVFGHLDNRLYEYLLEKSEDNLVNATHQTIAYDLGTSREVVSRLLKDFENHGKVILGRTMIKLLSVEDAPK